MMLGIGDTAAVLPATAPGFTDGLTLWGTPSAAFTAVQNVFSNASTAFSGTQLPYTAGLLAAPAAALLLLLSLAGGRR